MIRPDISTVNYLEVREKMKIKFKDKEYNGYVADNGNDILIAVIHTTESLNEIVSGLSDVTSVSTTSQDGTESVYAVTAALAAKQISLNVYSIEFSTKLTVEQEFEASLQSQSDAIDELLVMLLEG